MPNHCYQEVRLSGPRAMIGHLYESVWVSCVEERRFCDVVIPMPLSAAADAYDWRCKNWGTKWDVVDVQMINDFVEVPHKLSYGEYSNFASFTFKCWTAWAPPVPVWDKLHELGVRVHATYQDEGGMFEGEYHHGEDRSWDPEIKEEA